MVKQEMWSYSRLGLVNAQSIMHITFQLYDVLRFESTVVIYVLQQYIISKVKQPSTLKFRSLECMDVLLGEPQHLRLNYFAVANAENL